MNIVRWRIYLLLLLSAIVVISQSSCNLFGKKVKHNIEITAEEDNFSEKLKTILPKPDSATAAKLKGGRAELYQTYKDIEYLPIWVKDGFVATEGAKQFLKDLVDVKNDGLDPEKYHLSQLNKLISKLDSPRHDLNLALAFDTLATLSYINVTRDLYLGAINPKKVDSLWAHANDSDWAATKQLSLNVAKYYPINNYRSKVVTYGLLRDEYKKFCELEGDSTYVHAKNAITNLAGGQDSEYIADIQYIIKKELGNEISTKNDSIDLLAGLLSAYQYYNGLKVSGELDSATIGTLCLETTERLLKLSANMERVRWMQQSFGDRYIIVDIPLMEFFLREKEADSMHMRVVVGKFTRQTPSIFAHMSNVILNPRWEVPPTIIKQDVLPGIQKSGKKYLAKKGLRAFDRNGNAVSADMVNAKNYRRFSYRQAPGNDNALGNIKFNIPNPFDVYMHDTPHRTDFGKRERALSSGCVRLGAPRDLALYVFNKIEKMSMSEEKMDRVIKTHKTQWYVVKNKIPVHFTYLTTFEDSTKGHLRYLHDVYGRDVKLVAALGKK